MSVEVIQPAVDAMASTSVDLTQATGDALTNPLLWPGVPYAQATVTGSLTGSMPDQATGISTVTCLPSVFTTDPLTDLAVLLVVIVALSLVLPPLIFLYLGYLERWVQRFDRR